MIGEKKFVLTGEKISKLIIFKFFLLSETKDNTVLNDILTRYGIQRNIIFTQNLATSFTQFRQI